MELNGTVDEVEQGHNTDNKPCDIVALNSAGDRFDLFFLKVDGEDRSVWVDKRVKVLASRIKPLEPDYYVGIGESIELLDDA